MWDYIHHRSDDKVHHHGIDSKITGIGRASQGYGPFDEVLFMDEAVVDMVIGIAGCVLRGMHGHACGGYGMGLTRVFGHSSGWVGGAGDAL